MSDDATPRFALPLLSVGQAQKEMSHNEALSLLDFTVQAVAAEIGRNTPPTSPDLGACWVVGTTPSGVWTGHAKALAGWSGGGWRFVSPRAGMTVWSDADGANARFDGGEWQIGTLAGTRLVIAGNVVVGAQQAAIPTPSGGTSIDAEGRTTLAAILAALRSHGLIAT